MKTISRMEEYLYLVDETLFDANDLVMMLGAEDSGDDAADGDAGDAGDTASDKQQAADSHFMITLEAHLQSLQQSVADGSYAFADQDLPFMAVLREHRAQIPFADSLMLINRIHRDGLDG